MKRLAFYLAIILILILLSSLLSWKEESPPVFPSNPPFLPSIEIEKEIVIVDEEWKDLYPRPLTPRCVHWFTPPDLFLEKHEEVMDELKGMGIGMVVIAHGLEEYDVRVVKGIVKGLVKRGIIPVIRPMVRVGPLPSSFKDSLRQLIPSGAFYVQVFNEPNLPEEWGVEGMGVEGWVRWWEEGAKEVLKEGGFPGISPLSPSGGDEDWLRGFFKLASPSLLENSWLGVHAYYHFYDPEDERGFGLYRRYSRIARKVSGLSLPVIVTEGGISPEENLPREEWGKWIFSGYSYLEREGDPDLLAFCHWVLGSYEGRWKNVSWFDGEKFLLR
ncbi:MAG: hypothetical protein QXH03_00255 [Candidatus Bathyarchaeia archaeon]